MQTIAQLINGELKGAVSLKISENLTHFPSEIFELADTLEYLDLSSNQLCHLPNDFGRLKKLRILFASDNLFTALPEVLADCPLLDIVGFKSNQISVIPPRALNRNLRWLILTNNQIKTLPEEIRNCYRMQKLMLAGNKLTELPVGLSECLNLSLLRLAANSLTELPQWLTDMPKLSWIAFSGNKMAKTIAKRDVALIDHHALKFTDRLGEGASGIIYKAIYKQDVLSSEVAVKMFKGSVTSDGFPEDEMNAYIEAGDHEGLISLIGKIEIPETKETGLVMKLIPEGFYNLGLPPTLSSCTRDVFKDGMSLSSKQVLKIASTISSVAQQLHDKGIMHGDLYAHNILINQQGETLFGDFGAASFYDPGCKNSRSLERIEVSAFGYLLDDLLSLLASNEDTDVSNFFESLRDMCLSTEINERPGFKEITNQLNQFKQLRF